MDAAWQEVLAFAALFAAALFVLHRAWARRRQEGCSHCDAAGSPPRRPSRDGRLHLDVVK